MQIKIDEHLARLILVFATEYREKVQHEHDPKNLDDAFQMGAILEKVDALETKLKKAAGEKGGDGAAK